MNPTTHIKTLPGILIIALVVFAVACGGTATDTSASLDVIEDPHEAETVALDTHDDDDGAHIAESMVMDTHDDGDDGDIVEISLDVVEGAAVWGFSPDMIEVPLGHRVKLTLNNDGRAEHDIEITNLTAEHIETMAPMAYHDRLGGGGHDDTVVAAHAMPGTEASVLFTPTVAGEYEFHCTLPGHRELGMVGRIIVTDG